MTHARFRYEELDKWSISTEPIIIGTTLTLGPESITVIRPTENSTIFLLVQGTAQIDGSLTVDVSGRNYTATYTTIAVVKATEIRGGFETISVANADPKQYVFFFALLAWPCLVLKRAQVCNV